jgi:hypothetical protein
MSQSTGTANQRDDKGRFVKGNTCGRGNPFARQTAQLRRAAVDMVSEEDIRAIMAALILKAKQGDLAAARLVFAYGIGRPTEAENPDRLDAQEWQVWQERMADDKDGKAFMKAVPVDFYNNAAPILVEARVRQFDEEYLNQWQQRHPDEYEQHMRERAKLQEADPSANGDNGAPVEAADPSANGGNGSGDPVGRPAHNRVSRKAVPSSNGPDGHRRARSAPSANGPDGHDRPRSAEEAGTGNGQAGPGQAGGEGDGGDAGHLPTSARPLFPASRTDEPTMIGG